MRDEGRLQLLVGVPDLEDLEDADGDLQRLAQVAGHARHSSWSTA